MPARSFYADAEHEENMNPPDATANGDDMLNSDIEAQIDTDLASLEVEYSQPDAKHQTANRRTTDLVRLYLQEIGRVRLLGRDRAPPGRRVPPGRGPRRLALSLRSRRGNRATGG